MPFHEGLSPSGFVTRNQLGQLQVRRRVVQVDSGHVGHPLLEPQVELVPGLDEELKRSTEVLTLHIDDKLVTRGRTRDEPVLSVTPIRRSERS